MRVRRTLLISIFRMFNHFSILGRGVVVPVLVLRYRVIALKPGGLSVLKGIANTSSFVEGEGRTVPGISRTGHLQGTLVNIVSPI